MTYRYGLPSDEHLKAIGMVTAQWERLLSIVDVGIRALLEQEREEGEAIIPYIKFRERLDLLQERYRRRDSNETANEDLRYICNLIYNSIRPKRNEVVHCLWVLGTFDTAYRITIRASDGEPNRKASQGSLSSSAVAADIADGADRLIKFLYDYGVTEIEMETPRGQ